MIIEEAILQATYRVRANGILYLVTIDFNNISNCKIAYQKDGAQEVSFAKLITDRETWVSAVELKEFIDKKLSLLPVEADKKKNTMILDGSRVVERKPRKPYDLTKFKPKVCKKCEKEFTPTSSRQKMCSVCFDVVFKKRGIGFLESTNS